MSARTGASLRGSSTSLLPLRATVPYLLQRGSVLLSRELRTGAWSAARPPKPTIRRTLSLDAIVGPYLQGQWPREAEASGVTCVNDKATQTPSSWAEESPGRRSLGGHKRSASWGSAEHLREVARLRQQLQKRSRHTAPPSGFDAPHASGHAAGSTQTRIPLNRLAPRLRRSVEGLNLELEEVFVCEKHDDQLEILDVPDGHRAPVPVQRCSSGSQSESSPGTPDPALLSPPPSPGPLDPSPPDSPVNSASPPQSPCRMLEPEVLSSTPLSPPLILLPRRPGSPEPNKTFQRQPPEGCERVRVSEETMSCGPDEIFLPSSCPDLNKVNFTPHGGSAFCPVSLLKPLLPSMDLLFRGLTVSPVTGGPASPPRHLQ